MDSIVRAPSRDDLASELLQEAWGALNFILAFYEPDQRYLDTNAWKQAEAGGRRVHAKLRAYLDAATSEAAHGTARHNNQSSTDLSGSSDPVRSED
jgi:hypothetical protein